MTLPPTPQPSPLILPSLSLLPLPSSLTPRSRRRRLHKGGWAANMCTKAAGPLICTQRRLGRLHNE